MTSQLQRAVAGLFATVVILLASAGPVRAHGLEPALLALREQQPGVFAVAWKSSKIRLPGADVKPRLPARCRAVGSGEEIDLGDRTEARWTIDCGPE